MLNQYEINKQSIILVYIYMHIFFCGSRVKRARSSLQTSRIELILWLDYLTSRADQSWFDIHPYSYVSNKHQPKQLFCWLFSPNFLYFSP
jgi:hypothetical protein